MVTRQRAYPSGRQVSCSASSENHTYVKEYTHVAQYLLFNHYHPTLKNSLIWVRAQILKDANAAQLLLNRRYHHIRQPSSPVNTASAPRCPKWQNLVKKVGISTGGIYFLQKKCQKSSFQANSGQEIQKFEFSYGGGSCFLQKKVQNDHFSQKLSRIL